MRNNVFALWGVALWGGTVVLLVGITLTGRLDLLGAVLGYWLGFINLAWLHRDTLRSVDLDVRRAIARMRRSFFARLGVVTLFVVAIARWEKSWLLDFVFGIAAGLLISLLLYIRREIASGKG
ncbi:MAG: ATP synthase subunit I [Desulfitobacteriaceae bacterium]